MGKLINVSQMGLVSLMSLVSLNVMRCVENRSVRNECRKLGKS